MKIRARVVKIDGDWLAVAAVTEGARTATRHRWADTQGQAMRRAFELLAEIDAELMDEVHASRATRRAEVKP